MNYEGGKLLRYICLVRQFSVNSLKHGTYDLFHKKYKRWKEIFSLYKKFNMFLIIVKCRLYKFSSYLIVIVF